MMGLKQFNKDVALAKDASINRVSSIRRGDSDGELVFTYSHANLSSPLTIQVLILDTDSYPQSSSFMIFTASDCVEEGVTPFLEQLSGSMRRKNVEAVIETISERLTIKLETNPATKEESDLDGALAPEDNETSVEDDEEDEEDEYLFFETNVPKLPDEDPAFYLTASSVKRLRKDLRAAHSAGISVGVLPEGQSVRQAEMFSLSIRIGKLGIPEDALKAWDLAVDEYLVLLCRFPTGYPSVTDFLKLPCDQTTVQFRFGKCAESKPSLATARTSFLNPLDGSPVVHEELKVESTVEGHGDAFVPLYMSNSINLLLNKEFFRLLKTRRAHKKSWDATQEYLFQISRGEHRSSAGSNPQKSCDISQEDDDVPISIHAPSSLQHDYALDEEDDFSIPLVSMQFALRRMARCTQYCMVCYQRIREEFEALKPYACPNSLCLYQYITLGLGSSIEHEVTKNPYVVDLLVSFFCSAVGSQSLRKYPKGLNLKSVRTGTIQHPAEHIVAEACFKEKVIRLSSLDPTKRHTLKEGASIFVVIEGPEVVPTGSIMDGGLERHVCRVTSAKDDSYTFEILATQTTPLNVQPLPEHEKSTQASCPTDDWKRVLIFQFTHDLDKLPKPDRSVALMLLTAGIPSVLKMRTYLLQNPGRRLVSWNQIDNNSLTLLHWIVASNRSLILQDDAVPSSELTENASNRDGSESPEPMTTNPNKVKGMPETWMQFRFLQGTPEREKLFMKALQSTTGAPTNGKQYPTLFAWHGSPLHNWHSIIRTGLDFRIVANGRTFGNGVYFNPCLAVSCGYAVKSSRNIMHPSAWQNSELRPSSAVSMCEIINRPQDFVSMSPHYVVDKLEWIQCRYLFVEVLPTSDALEQPFPTPPIQDCVGYADQNPRRQLTGRLGNRIQIPLSAVSSQRRGAVGTSEQIYPVKALTKQKNLSSSELADDDDNEIDAALLLDSDDEVGSLNDTRKRRRSPSLDSGSQTSSKLSTAAYKLKNSEENTPAQSEKVFRPGTLDLTSLPRLPDPAWASSSPGALQNLSRAIKELQKIQSQSNITSLGWYIDFDNLNNMFHWIVQLHSFDADLPLAKDMEEMDCTSVVLELRFGGNYPFSPPFVRVIRPRFLPFARGGGGHVTAGGAICSELLTNSGWSPALTIEKVLLQVRLGLCELDPPARLDKSQMARSHPTQNDYGIREAMEAYTRAARSHGWQIPGDIKKIAAATWRA